MPHFPQAHGAHGAWHNALLSSPSEAGGLSLSPRMALGLKGGSCGNAAFLAVQGSLPACSLEGEAWQGGLPRQSRWRVCLKQPSRFGQAALW